MYAFLTGTVRSPYRNSAILVQLSAKNFNRRKLSLEWNRKVNSPGQHTLGANWNMAMGYNSYLSWRYKQEHVNWREVSDVGANWIPTKGTYYKKSGNGVLIHITLISLIKLQVTPKQKGMRVRVKLIISWIISMKGRRSQTLSALKWLEDIKTTLK